MRIGIFGGSFNPPHIAHQLIALYLLETAAVDELWFVPVFVHAFGKALAPYDARIEMCRRITEPLGPAAKVIRAEEEVAARADLVAGRTLDLLTLLAEQHPGDELRLVIGADILADTAKWHRWDDVIAKAPPLVVGRAGYPLPPGGSQTGIVMPQVSATHVRDLLAQLSPAVRAHLAGPPSVQDPSIATELRTLLPKTVLWYIARSGLYT